jgi:hypothetical protein
MRPLPPRTLFITSGRCDVETDAALIILLSKWLLLLLLIRRRTLNPCVVIYGPTSKKSIVNNVSYGSCNICKKKKTFKLLYGSTSALRQHLKGAHLTTHHELLPAESQLSICHALICVLLCSLQGSEYMSE